ncbi:MAG: serine hydrolase [Desulfopila sp.]
MHRFFLTLLVSLLVIFLQVPAYAKGDTYDIAYIWSDNLEDVLDYQQELEELLGPGDSKNLRIVGRHSGEVGIIYDLDGSALGSVQLMVKHSELLREQGFPESSTVDANSYYHLFNVSYGLGPNIEALKKRYSVIYNYLGEEVGKNLFIEKTDADNYTLIYRRRGDRTSSVVVARKHAKLLKRRGIGTSITPERNYPVVFGESSHLDGTSNSGAGSTTVEEQEQGDSSVTPARVAVKKSTPKAESKMTTASRPMQILKAEPKKRKITVVASASGRNSGQSVVQYSVKSLSESSVERSIEELIKKMRRQGKLDRDESTGWMVYDLTSEKSVVDINADKIFQAASMIKPFVALVFFHRVKQGELFYGQRSQRKMEAMIQRSDNGAANWVMRYAGGPSRVEEILRSEYGHIFKDTRITEYIPPGGRTYKNKALPSDYIRFLLALWRDELPYSKEMRRVMSLPGRDRLYNGTPIPRGTLVYNKTGSTAHLCGDMGILVLRDRQGRRYPYALVGVIERVSRPKNYGNWMLTRGNVIRKVSTLVYEEMKKEYRLL